MRPGGIVGLLLQTELFREVWDLPRRSAAGRIVLFAMAYLAKVFRWLGAWLDQRRVGGRDVSVGLCDDVHGPEAKECLLCGKGLPTGGVALSGGLSLKTCTTCGLRNVVPPPTPRALSSVATGPTRASLGAFDGVDRLLVAHRRFRRLELVRPPGRFLVVAESIREVVSAAFERGYEPSAATVQALAGSPEEVPKGEFDLIVLDGLLERAASPRTVATIVTRSLAPDGLLVVVTPNGGSPGWAGPLGHSQRDVLRGCRCLWDCPRLERLMSGVGLELFDVETEIAGGLARAGQLMAVFRRRDYDFPEDVSRITVRCDAARGDTLLAIPILEGLHGRRPKARLRVPTNFPALLQGFDFVDCVPVMTPTADRATVRARYDLDPRRHVVDVMAQRCRAGPVPHRVTYEIGMAEQEVARGFLRSRGVGERVVVLHPMAGQRAKRWPVERWQAVADGLRMRGFGVVSLGASGDSAHVNGVLDLLGALSLRESLAVLGQASAFVGLDSFLAHAAGALGVPRVLLFGSTDPERILCDSDRTPTIVIRGDCPWLGCRHDCYPDQWPRNAGCRRSEGHCLDVIADESVVEAVLGVVKGVGAPLPVE